MRVPILGKLALDAILAELAQAMQDCRQLYLSCVPPSPGFQQAATQQLAVSQDRLHRGLLAKIYATIAEADGRWTYEEQRCVTALLQHVGVSWSPDQLEETARKVARQAAKLDWQRLLQPFRAIPELRARTADLETVVVRVANLIAKADGLVAAKETAVLHAIQEEFRAERPFALPQGRRQRLRTPRQLRSKPTCRGWEPLCRSRAKRVNTDAGPVAGTEPAETGCVGRLAARQAGNSRAGRLGVPPESAPPRRSCPTNRRIRGSCLSAGQERERRKSRDCCPKSWQPAAC